MSKLLDELTQLRKNLDLNTKKTPDYHINNAPDYHINYKVVANEKASDLKKENAKKDRAKNFNKVNNQPKNPDDLVTDNVRTEIVYYIQHGGLRLPKGCQVIVSGDMSSRKFYEFNRKKFVEVANTWITDARTLVFYVDNNTIYQGSNKDKIYMAKI